MPRMRSALVVAGLCLGLLVAAAAPPAAAARDRTAPTTPSNLRITASTSDGVSLAWNASKDNSRNFWYCVQTGGSGCIRVDPPRTTVTLRPLLPNRTFTFSVVAVDAAGNRSANSNTVTFSTPGDTTPPSPAPVLSATAVFPTRVSLAWTPAVDNISQVWTTLLQNGSPVFVDRLGPPNYTLVTLSPATTYQFQVTVRDASHNVAASNVLSVTTPAAADAQAPTVPTNQRVTSESFSPEIWLRWDQSTDDTDPQSLIRYETFLDGVLASSVTGVGRTIITCVAEGTGPAQILTRAVDTSGNASAFSNAVTFNC